MNFAQSVSQGAWFALACNPQSSAPFYQYCLSHIFLYKTSFLPSFYLKIKQSFQNLYESHWKNVNKQYPGFGQSGCKSVTASNNIMQAEYSSVSKEQMGQWGLINVEHIHMCVQQQLVSKTSHGLKGEWKGVYRKFWRGEIPK